MDDGRWTMDSNPKSLTPTPDPRPPTPEWRMRPYAPGDEVDLAGVFYEVFGKEVTPEWWVWKLKGKPSPVENVLVAVSEADGRAVAQHVGIPVRVKLGGEISDLMLCVDVMT